MVSISSIAGSAVVQQSQSIKKTDAKLQTAIANLLSGKRSQDVANVAVATQLQAQTAGLKQVSANIAQASSAAQVAGDAIGQVQEIVGRLREVAVRANAGSTSDNDRAALNEEFQGLVRELDAQVKNTQFNGKNLLDGTLRGDNSLSLNSLLASGEGDDAALEIDNLSSFVLFKNQTPNVLTKESATDAIAALSVAQGQITAARASVGSFQQTLNYSAATIDTVAANLEAARSSLDDADFLEASTLSNQATVQRNAQLSLAAQGNRLPAALLKLVS